MNLLDTLERRFGHWAIPGLIRSIAILNGVVFVLGLVNPAILQWLDLDKAAILTRHEYWRLLTYILIPKTMSPIFIIFAIWMSFTISDGLERAWGAFRINLFYLVGMLGTTVAAFAFGAEFSNSMLNMSLFFAFAWFYPDLQISLIIIPVRVRWVAWFSAAMLLLQMAAGNNALRMATIASMANYLLFFGPQIFANARQRRTVVLRRAEYDKASIPVETALYCCKVCQRTDQKNPEISFRVGADGNDYCTEHLPQR